MVRAGNRLRAGCRRFQPGLPDPGGGFFAAGGASRSRWANFFSRCAFSRENDASPRASRAGGSPGGSGVTVTSGATSRSSCAICAGASGEGSRSVDSASKGTSSAIGEVGAGSEWITAASAVGPGSKGGGIGAGRGVAAGRGISGWSPPGGRSGRGGSAADVPSARFRLCQSPGFRREEESSEGSTSRGCGRPKRRSGATS